MTETDPVLIWRSINTIRCLAMDAVEQAQSGHPGTPMALAPVGWLLWTRHLKHDPAHPDWPNRDRFVLSCGHASMLLYGLLHLTGYDLPLEEIKRFRQWGSRTPGHPEHGLTPGVETTTGPLGQGIGNAVGMAIAERVLAERFNQTGQDVIDHRVWCFASDGDLMEGVASEACSLAGHLRLGKLTIIYDDNHITIDGDTARTFDEDVAARFRAYGWRVLQVADGNDLSAIDQALTDAGGESNRPTLIVLRTIIGYPAPTRQNSAKAHGEPLGAEEVKKTKELLGCPSTSRFTFRRTWRTRHRKPASGAPHSMKSGTGVSSATGRNTPTWPDSLTTPSPGASRWTGAHCCRNSRRVPRSLPGRRRVRCWSD